MRTLCAALVAATLASACVRTIALQSPAAVARQDRIELEVPVLAPDPAPRVVVPPIDDRRPWPRVGEVRNGIGMHVVRVETDSDLDAWVRDALAGELEAAGFPVVGGTSGPSPSTPRADVAVEVRLHEAFADLRFHQEARVDLTVFVRRVSDRAILVFERVARAVSLEDDGEPRHAEALGRALGLVAEDVARLVARAMNPRTAESDGTLPSEGVGGSETRR